MNFLSLLLSFFHCLFLADNGRADDGKRLEALASRWTLRSFQPFDLGETGGGPGGGGKIIAPWPKVGG